MHSSSSPTSAHHPETPRTRAHAGQCHPSLPEERERRIHQHLCLYCGESRHLRVACPARPSRRDSTTVSADYYNHNTSFGIPITINIDEGRIETISMIDSGAEGNFIDISFANFHNLPLISCESRVVVVVLDGRPLGSGKIKYLTPELRLQTVVLHPESIRLFAIESPQNPVILGLSWLEKHNPRISWSTQQFLQWSEFCQHHCLTSSSKSTALPVEEKPELKDLPELPIEYQDLSEAFSKAKASKHPLHRPSDCAIDLIPGLTPPRGRIFPLSQPESETMKQYIEEELSKGFIVPSKSPASAGFFFVKKKDGGLRPCIDYRAHNDITIKFRYPLPLLPAALEQLRTAKYFTKLDLRSAYNLNRIREGDEWKTAHPGTMNIGLCRSG